jgi:hypothetical protein
MMLQLLLGLSCVFGSANAFSLVVPLDTRSHQRQSLTRAFAYSLGPPPPPGSYGGTGGPQGGPPRGPPGPPGPPGGRPPFVPRSADAPNLAGPIGPSAARIQNLEDKINPVKAQQANEQLRVNIDNGSSPINIQGGALRTWSCPGSVDRLMVSMHTEGPPEGFPLVAKIDLCQGPNNKPLEMKVKSGKGRLRPFRCVIETPGDGSSLFIRNTEDMTFPIVARVTSASEKEDPDSQAVLTKDIYTMSDVKELQGGGAVLTWPFESNVQKVKVVVSTYGRPLNCSIELVQGPNAVKCLLEIYTQDGMLRPFCAIIETPGAQNMIRVFTSSTLEFPVNVAVDVFETNN